MRRLALRGVVPLALAGCVCVTVFSQAPSARHERNPTVVPARAGLLTDRLSPKDLPRWVAIERLVFQQDNEGRFLHPTLRGLWEWIETSGHTVYIEFVKPSVSVTSTAGYFRLERLDPRGERHTGVIQLNLGNIDAAYVGRETWRAPGFIPFDRLYREERYAEVLGHELAHAADILTSLEKTSRVEDLIERTNQMLLHHRSLRPTEQLTIELSRRLTRRDAILKVLESTAEKMEAAVWRELVASKALRDKLGNPANK